MEWHQIPFAQAGYFVSKEGDFKTPKGKKKLRTTGNYVCVCYLDHHGVRHAIWLHRLMAYVFLPNPKEKPLVNHIDRNRANNNILNLEWATHSENTTHYHGCNRKEYAKFISGLTVRVRATNEIGTIEYTDNKYVYVDINDYPRVFIYTELEIL
jgi:hypothetical protein